MLFMNMYEELKAWADKWGVKYDCAENSSNHYCDISFEGGTYSFATFSFSFNNHGKDYSLSTPCCLFL